MMADLTVWLVLMGFVLGVVGGLGGRILWVLLMDFWYPIYVPVMIQRGKSTVWDLTERARHITRKDGSEALQLKKRRKTTLKPPKYDAVSVNNKGKAVYPVYNSIHGQFFPVKMANKSISLEVVEDKSAKNWGISEMTRVMNVYAPKEGWLAKYGVFIMNATFAAMVIFFTIYFSGKIEISSAALASGANRMADAVEMLAAKG